MPPETDWGPTGVKGLTAGTHRLPQQSMCIVEPVIFHFGNPGSRLAQPHSLCEQHSCGGASSRDSMSRLLLHITRTVLSKNRNDLLSVVIFTLYQHLTTVSMYSMHLSQTWVTDSFSPSVSSVLLIIGKPYVQRHIRMLTAGEDHTNLFQESDRRLCEHVTNQFQ